MRDLFSGFGCSTGPMVSLGDGDQFDASWLRARFSGIMESDHTAEPRAERVVTGRGYLVIITQTSFALTRGFIEAPLNS